MRAKKISNGTTVPNRGRARWLIANYLPTTLFSLRLTQANSKGGKTGILPTPYAMKMALIDAAFRMASETEAQNLAKSVFDCVKERDIRFLPPATAVVQNTFIRVLDESDGPEQFKRTIAYREFVYYQDEIRVAIGVGGCRSEEEDLIRRLFLHINYLGKRGGFMQFTGYEVIDGDLPLGFSVPVADAGGDLSRYGLVRALDDFGPALCSARDGFERISTYGSKPITLGEHRVLVPTLIGLFQREANRRSTIYRVPTSHSQ